MVSQARPNQSTQVSMSFKVVRFYVFHSFLDNLPELVSKGLRLVAVDAVVVAGEFGDVQYASYDFLCRVWQSNSSVL